MHLSHKQLSLNVDSGVCGLYRVRKIIFFACHWTGQIGGHHRRQLLRECQYLIIALTYRNLEIWVI